jgi:hypothetical protein
MTSPAYQLLVFIAPESNIDFLVLKEKLIDFCVQHAQPITMDVEFPNIRIIFESDYTFSIYYSQAENVLQHATALSEEFTEPRLAQCQSRYEVAADADEAQQYFDDALQIQQIFESFSQVFIFEPQTEVLTYF